MLDREKAGKLLLVCSGKSGKLYPVSRALYRQCLEPHIRGDSEHTCEDVTKPEKQFNGDSKQILRAFKCGKDWRQEDRFNSACKMENHEVPSIKQLLKDHKDHMDHKDHKDETYVQIQGPAGPKWSPGRPGV